MFEVPHPVRLSLEALCRQHGVRRLELFGSATGPAFEPERSDLDLLVEFDRPPSGSYFDQYFGFREGVEKLFGHRVDLVELRALRNPFFLRSIEGSRALLFAA